MHFVTVFTLGDWVSLFLGLFALIIYLRWRAKRAWKRRFGKTAGEE